MKQAEEKKAHVPRQAEPKKECSKPDCCSKNVSQLCCGMEANWKLPEGKCSNDMPAKIPTTYGALAKQTSMMRQTAVRVEPIAAK